MRSLAPNLDKALNSGATTFCRCWRIVRADGIRLGFTDHDRPLSFDGTSFEASSGLYASALDVQSGLSVNSHTVSGAIKSETISEQDLERGLYNGALVTLWLVNWRNFEDRLILSRGYIGEIRRQGASFEVEIVGLSERLNQPVGRAYLPTCDSQLGDRRCGVDLEASLYRGEAFVETSQSAGEITVAGLERFDAGHFAGGALKWLSGKNLGEEAVVRGHILRGDTVALQLWFSPTFAPAIGDRVVVTAGCDKRMVTCSAKFENLLNFRGFPHMPGDDFAAGYPNEGGAHDGRSLFDR